MSGLSEGRVGCCVVAGLSKGRSGACTFVKSTLLLQFRAVSLKIHPCQKRNSHGGIICCFAIGCSSWLVREAWWESPDSTRRGAEALLAPRCSGAHCLSLLQRCGWREGCRSRVPAASVPGAGSLCHLPQMPLHGPAAGTVQLQPGCLAG